MNRRNVFQLLGAVVIGATLGLRPFQFINAPRYGRAVFTMGGAVWREEDEPYTDDVVVQFQGVSFSEDGKTWSEPDGSRKWPLNLSARSADGSMPLSPVIPGVLAWPALIVTHGAAHRG